MAKAPAAAQAPLEAAPRKSKKLLLILVGAMVVLLVVAAAVVALLVMKKGGDKAGEAEPAHAAVDLSHPPTFVTLEPFTVNLNPAEGDRYLQVAVVLRVADAKLGEEMKNFMPEIRHRVNLLLSSKLPSELATTEGREQLADEIRDEANYVLGYTPPKGAKPGATDEAAPIQAVLFNSLIIQ